VIRSGGAATVGGRSVTVAAALFASFGYGSAVAQEIRNLPAERASPALYCGNVTLALYTRNAGNPATEFRAGDYAAGIAGQRYFIDPQIGGTIEGVWYQPAGDLANLALFRILTVGPSPNNDRIFILEILAEPDVGPGRAAIVVHFACRPAAP
jgi:hypothetical protein